MDLDALVSAHQWEWERLAQLVKKRHLSGAEADEILDRYQRTATHLSLVRSASPDPSLVAYLSSLLARARSRSAGARSSTWADVGHFFTDTFPAALYRLRRWWIATALANIAGMFAMGWWFLAHPEILASRMPQSQIDQLVNSDFQGYYSEYAASHFAGLVWVNNAQVAALCIALGILGVPVLILLASNVLNIAASGAVLTQYGRGTLFFGLILPHGMLELTAIFVAGGVGLRLFWSWIEPGSRTRSQSVAAEGRSAATVAIGLVVVLLLSGIIEAFVTPSGLPTWARIGIGALAEVGFLTYVFTAGRWAFGRGETGDLAARDDGDVAPAHA